MSIIMDTSPFMSIEMDTFRMTGRPLKWTSCNFQIPVHIIILTYQVYSWHVIVLGTHINESGPKWLTLLRRAGTKVPGTRGID